MLTCIACSKQLGGSLQQEPDEDDVAGTPGTRQAIRALTSQIKDMAMKASGAYRHCKPCAGSSPHHHRHADYADQSETGSDAGRYPYSPYRRGVPPVGGGGGGGGRRRPVVGPAWTPRSALREEIEARLRAITGGEVTPSLSGRTEDSGLQLPEEEEAEEVLREWVAQVEPGVLITFVSLPRGRNDLRRIRFSRDMFNRWQAQRWWAENSDKVMELYNVQMFHRQAFPLPTPPRSEDESSKVESAEESPETPPLIQERLPGNLCRSAGPGGMMGYSSSDSLDHHPIRRVPGRRRHQDSGHLLTPATPKLSSLGGGRTETAASSAAASARTSSSPGEDEALDRSACPSDASDLQEREWVEQDEPGVYITIRVLPGGARELRRVRFSRERFGEMHARLWWDENRARIHEQYL